MYSLTVNRKSIATSSIDLQHCRPAVQCSKREKSGRDRGRRRKRERDGKQESKLDEPWKGSKKNKPL